MLNKHGYEMKNLKAICSMTKNACFMNGYHIEIAYEDGKILVEEHFGWVGSQSVNLQPGVIPCGYITKRMSQQEIADFVAEAIDHYNYIAC